MTQEISTNGSGQMPRSEDELVPYVVQVQEDAVNDSGLVLWSGWRDVATVRVPPRTKKRTVIEKGLADAGIEKTLELEARLLDEDAAYVWRPAPPAPAALRLT